MNVEPTAHEMAVRDLFQGRLLAAFFKDVLAPVGKFAAGG
jgi:hypothetical protein